MAISFVNSAKAGSATVTLPTGIQLNDIIVLVGYRNATTAPSLPAGYTTPTNGTVSANANSMRVCYKTAAGTESGTTVTLTNANVVQCVVYRGCYVVGSTPGITSNAASLTTNLAASTPDIADGTSWGVYYCGSKQTTSQSTPAGTTIRGATQTGTTSILFIGDTNGGAATIPSKTSTAGASATGAGGSLELKATVPSTNLTDNFDANAIDGTKWDNGTVGAGSTIADSSNQIIETPAAATADAEGYLVGVGFIPKYNLTGSYFVVNLRQALNADTAAHTWFQVIANNSNILKFDVTGSPRTISAIKTVGGADTSVASTTYDPTAHSWLRIRESGGTIFWDVSDGQTWTNLGSVANPFGILSVYPKLNAYAGIVTTPGFAVWDSFNLFPPIKNRLLQLNRAVARANNY